MADGGEVILCGGTFNSPQLLMLSGIGPADELSAVGVRPVHDLPAVGRNLQDHPLVPVIYQPSRPLGFDGFMRLDRFVGAGTRWLATGKADRSPTRRCRCRGICAAILPVSGRTLSFR